MEQYTYDRARNYSLLNLFFMLCAIFVVLNPVYAFANDQVVARVGDIDISSIELNEALNRYIPRGSLHGTIQGSQLSEYRKKALDELIEVELLYREAHIRGITVSDKDVSDIVEINRKRIGSEDDFDNALKSRGLTLSAFGERIKKYAMVNSLMNRLFEQSAYSEKELQAYYQNNIDSFKKPGSVHLYQILLNVSSTAPEDEWQKKKQFAEELRDRILSGEDFSEIAYKHSEGPYRVKGGDLGFVHRGRLTPQELDDAAFSLGQGELSAVFRTIHGYHILKAGEAKPPRTLGFDEVRDSLAKRLQQQRMDAKKQALLERLRNEYPVEIYKASDG